MKEAAVSWVERDGKVLVVWDRRYRGWTLPGGLVEEGEAPPQAMARELREETGLVVTSAPVIYDAPAEQGRGSHVWVFRCDETTGTASEREPGCPVMWVTRDEYLALCPFKRFYERMFTKLGWDFAEEVLSQSTAIIKHPGPSAYVEVRLLGILYVSELDTPASSLVEPVAKLLERFGHARVSVVLASEAVLGEERS
jgi:8-oxo-dGTP diphosphatase